MAVYCFSLAWWSGWECAALLMPTRELAFLLLRIEYIGVVFISTLFCTTVSYLLKFSPQRRKRLLLPLYAGSLIFLLPATFFPSQKFLWVSPGPVSYLPVWGSAGSYYWTFLAFFIATGVIGHILAFCGWYRSTGEERIRLFLFSAGTSIAYFCGCPEFALKYGIRLGWLNPFGLYIFPIYIGLLTYAIVRHRFLDIQIVIRRSLVYSLLISLLTIGYFAIIFLIESLFRDRLGYRSPVFSVLAFAIMAMVFQPLKIWVQRLVDWLIFRAPQEEIARRMERLEEEAKQTERLRSVATLAAGMAHEIKNPLTALQTFAEFIPERHRDRAFAAKLHDVFTTETRRIREIVQAVLDFARPKTPQLKPVDPERVIASTVDLLSNDLLKRRVKWTVDCQHNGATLQADPDQLRQVLINLIQNAADAMPKGGSLSIATKSENGHVEMTVSDTGQGIPPELLPKIFDPFVSTKPNGNGLGLSVVHSIVRAHRGTIRAHSEAGKGTTLTVRLPL